jgi:hypothetical protein
MTQRDGVRLMLYVVPIELLCLCVVCIILMASFLAASAE